MYRVSLADQGTQINSAVAHARAGIEKHPGRLVYFLSVNKARVDRNARYHWQILRTLADHGITADGEIRIVPVWEPDFAMRTGSIFFGLEPQALHFGAHMLAASLDGAHRAILRPHLPSPTDKAKEMWLVDLLQQVIEETLAHDPDDPQPH